jgi:sugar/nucleoside kinase (ribokinase family)
VDESGFKALIELGAVFVGFYRSISEPNPTFLHAVRAAAENVTAFKPSARWALWDVQKTLPSFYKQFRFLVPGLFYFPSGNYSDASVYNGKEEGNLISEWALNQFPVYDTL